MNCHCCSGEAKYFAKFKNRNRVVKRYRCVRCGKTFSEKQPLEGLRIETDKVVQVIKLFTEGCSVRATSRLTGLDKGTVLSVLETIGQKCQLFHDTVVRNVQTESIQLDELWARVGLRQSRITSLDTEKGDFYTFLGVDRRTKLIISHLTDRRDASSANDFVADLAERVPGIVQITCDGFQPYVSAIREHLLGRVNLAVMQKLYGHDRFNRSNDPNHRYGQPACTGIRVRSCVGHPDPAKICTSHIERLNLSVRTFNRRFTRLALGWSRKLANHRYAIALFVVTYNFCKRHETLGCTPACGAKLTDHDWTVEELLEKICTI